LDRTNILHRYKYPGTYTVKLKAVDQGTCIGRDSTKTTLLVSTPLGFADPDLLMCYNAGTQLVAGGGVTYLWTTANKSFSSNQPNVVVNPKVSIFYFISIVDINGCTKKDTVNVRVVPNIDLKFTAERVNYDCFDRPSLKVSSQTDPSETVFFDFGDGTTSDLQSTVHNYTRDGNFAVRLIGKKEACIYESEINLPIFELKVPNVFTPDQSPGFNDTFQISYGGQTISQAGISASIVIYNRWGGKVFESKDYKGDWTATDLPSGVYYYDIQIMNETSCKGWVQVIR
jgi:gliding motility-associated-like protein